MTSPHSIYKPSISEEAMQKFKSQDISETIEKVFPQKFAMPVVDFEWPALTEYDLTQANQKPVEASAIELGYQIEKLERDLAFEKESLRKVKQEYQTYMDDYKRLDVDYLNSQYQVMLLQAQVDKIPTLKRTIKYLMAEHLDIELGDE